MRIIAGRYARRKLLSPKGHLTRPTMSQTREALFHLVSSRLSLEGVDVLDLFAGTGALGLEALSRGAESSSFVEIDGRVLKFARRNAEELGVTEKCMFIRTDAVTFLQRYSGPPFSLILADPPYDLSAMERMPAIALPHVTTDGLFVLEHDKRIFFDEHPNLDTSRPYGRTYVSVFRPKYADVRVEGGDNADVEDTDDRNDARGEL